MMTRQMMTIALPAAGAFVAYRMYNGDMMWTLGGAAAGYVASMVMG